MLAGPIVLRSCHKPSRRRGRVSRALAIVVFGLCSAGQLLSVAHESTERHVRCAEHGEVTHVPTDLASQPVAPQSDSPALRGARGAEAGHDHCDFVACFQRRRPEPILLVRAAPEPAPPCAPAPAPVLESQTERILLSAPKIAPPC